MSDKKLVPQNGGGSLVPHDYGQDAGVGMDITPDDLLMPLVVLLQDNSPELKKANPDYLPDAAAGMMLNRATGELSERLVLVPATRQTQFLEWVPRAQAGGLAGIHDRSSRVVSEALARNGGNVVGLTTKGGNSLVETKTISAVQLDPETREPIGSVVIPFTSTKIKQWKRYWNKLDAAKICKGAPIFSNTIELTSFDDSNKKGEFKNYSMVPLNGGVVDSMLGPDSAAYQAGKHLRELIQAGTATVDMADSQDRQEDSVF